MDIVIRAGHGGPVYFGEVKIINNYVTVVGTFICTETINNETHVCDSHAVVQ